MIYLWIYLTGYILAYLLLLWNTATTHHVLELSDLFSNFIPSFLSWILAFSIIFVFIRDKHIVIWRKK